MHSGQVTPRTTPPGSLAIQLGPAMNGRAFDVKTQWLHVKVATCQGPRSNEVSQGPQGSNEEGQTNMVQHGLQR